MSDGTLKIRRGLSAERPTLAEGEFGLDTDTYDVYIGTSAGNKLITVSGGGVTAHGNLTGLDADDHNQYILVDGSRGFTGTVSGVTPTEDYHLATKAYADTISGAGGVSDHGDLTGLVDDDHTQYILSDGIRPFTGTVSGVTPTEDAHLATKGYVDTISGISADVDYNDYAITNISGVGFSGGQEITWNSDDLTLNIPTGLGPVLQVGQEQYVHVYNNTGSTISNGTAVHVIGAIDGYPLVQPSLAYDYNGVDNKIFLTTMDIPTGTSGIALERGKMREIDTSSWALGDYVWISDTVSGTLTNTRPSFPSFALPVGSVNKVGTEGVIQVHFGGGPEYTIMNAWNGVFRESFDFRTSSSGTTVTGTLEPSGSHDDMTMMFSDGFSMFDTSPPAEIILTPGTDSNPQTNYVYIPKSTKVLTASTSSWPADSVEHIKIAEVVLQSAGATASGGALRNQNWNDHIQDTSSGQGHLSHIGAAVRMKIPAAWMNGIEGTCTIDTGPTPDDVWVSTTAGTIMQMHHQSFPAFDTQTGSDIHVVNHPDNAYTRVTNLNVLLEDAAGGTLNNRSFSFVLWGVGNKTGEASHLMLNLPSDSYAFSTPNLAVSDANNYSVYTIPNKFSGVGFLISRFTFTYKNDDWVLYDTEDLRGYNPNTTAGGGAGGTGVTTYLGLSDTPSAYTGHANKHVTVNTSETALEFTTLTAANLTNAERDALTPGNGMIIYNTTSGTFNFYENGAWVTK